MKITAKIINTRFSSWEDKKTGAIKTYLIVSVKTIDGNKYALNTYGKKIALLNNKKGALVSLDIKNIKNFKNYYGVSNNIPLTSIIKKRETKTICFIVEAGKTYFVNSTPPSVRDWKLYLSDNALLISCDE